MQTSICFFYCTFADKKKCMTAVFSLRSQTQTCLCLGCWFRFNNDLEEWFGDYKSLPKKTETHICLHAYFSLGHTDLPQ